MKLNTTRMLILCLSPILTACSTAQENFSTEPGQGFGWKSMQENHKRIQAELEAPQDSVFFQQVPVMVSWKNRGDVKRSPERTIRIWKAPYQDAYGNLYEEGVIHTVVQGGQWHVSGPQSESH
jgi:Type IV conjugative transfer system lipoprotein (TraV)